MNMQKLKGYIEQVRGVSYKPIDVRDAQSGVAVLRANNIQDKVDMSDLVFVDASKIADIQYLKKGDVLICASSGSKNLVGKAVVIPHDLDAAFGAFCKVVRIKAVSNVNPEFIRLFFLSKNYRDAISECSVGANINNIKTDHLDNLRINILDYNIQCFAVEYLHKLQRAIDLKRKQLNDLDELVKSKFQEMFGDVMLPESKWEQTTFGKAFDICSGGTPSTSKKEYWDNGTIAWIGSNMCQDWIIYKNDGKFITQEGLEHSSAKLLESGTVLVALVGATIGKTALLRFRTTTNQNVAAIKVNDNSDYYPEFVFYLLQGLYGKFMNYSNGKFAMATLSFVRDLPLIKPPRNLQGEFVDYVGKVNSLKGICEREIAELNELMDSKMDEYFGKKDEP